MGEGPNSRPRRFLLSGGGGFADFCLLGGEQSPMAKPRRPHRAGTGWERVGTRWERDGIGWERVGEGWDRWERVGTG